MSRTDEVIKAYFERTGPLPGRGVRPGAYPGPEDLAAFIDDRLKDAELERMLAYLQSNPEAQALVRTLRGLLSSLEGSNAEKVPQALLDRAKGLGSGRRPAPKRSLWPLWTVLSIAALAGSFLVPHYYVQFVAAGVLLGVKAIVDQKAAKTQIFIYKALEDAEKSHLHGR
jgi:anti-sigma factor RsiW